MREETGREFPQDPREQLDLAVRAVFDSWNTDRARLYRRQERIPHDLGTAVNVQTMVFGNLGEDSGTGVAFTRDPGTGTSGVYGDYLPDAQGEDVVAGIRNTLLARGARRPRPRELRRSSSTSCTRSRRTTATCATSSSPIERGKLWMLQTRVGKRTAGAAFRIAVQLVDEGVIDVDEALTRVTGAQLSQLMFPRFDDTGAHTLLAQGHERLARRGRRQGRLRLRHRRRSGRTAARRSSSCAARPTPTTSTA